MGWVVRSEDWGVAQLGIQFLIKGEWRMDNGEK